MKSTRKQLQQPVELTCREHTIALLDVAATQLDRLGSADDPEALHDFRVSVRRLRTYLGAYRSFLPKSLGKRARKELGRLISATNRGRDDEVQLRWLDRQLEHKNLPKLTQQGYALVRGDFDAAPFNSDSEELASVIHGFSTVEHRLRGHLSQPLRTIRLTDAGKSLSFAAATGEIVREMSTKLGERLAAIESLGQEKRLHRTRLAAKRLRYVLEPVRLLVTGGRTAVTRLKGLQDVLGDLHDLQVLEQRVRARMKHDVAEWSRGLVAVATSETQLSAVNRKGGDTDSVRALAAALQGVRRAELRLFGRFAERWLKGNAEPFMLQAGNIALQLLPADLLTRRGETAGVAVSKKA
ncbi:MAG: CHAD domain-containing protein [Gemmatimonadota bacterium]|nr:MAG: CHAD domain-containing protein [Gemmatimonadota bacterium]